MSRNSDGKGSILDWPERAGKADEVLRAVEAGVRRRFRRRLAQLSAAALVLAAGASVWRLTTGPSAPKAPEVVIIQPAHRLLPDGSVVDLREGAIIAVDYDGPYRRVDLRRGEAVFHVAKNPSRPFVVRAGEVEVRAVGTAFFVRLDSDAVDVLVTNGRVAVDWTSETAGAHPTLVGAGQAVKVEPHLAGAPAPRVVPAPEIDRLLAWRVPSLEFSGTPLRDVVPMLNRYGRTPVILGDPSLGSLRVSGVMRADNTEAMLRFLVTTFGISIEHRGSEEVIRAKAK